MEEVATMSGDIISKPLVQVEILPPGSESGYVEGKDEGANLEEGFEYLEKDTRVN